MGGGCRWTKGRPRGSSQEWSDRSWCRLLILGCWCFQPFRGGHALGEPHSAVGLPGASVLAGAEIPLLSIIIQPITLPSAPSSGVQHPVMSQAPALPPSLFLLPYAHLGEPHGFFWGNPLGLLLAPHPSSSRASCGRRKVSPPNKFRFNLQVKKSVFFCS